MKLLIISSATGLHENSRNWPHSGSVGRFSRPRMDLTGNNQFLVDGSDILMVGYNQDLAVKSPQRLGNGSENSHRSHGIGSNWK